MIGRILAAGCTCMALGAFAGCGGSDESVPDAPVTSNPFANRGGAATGSGQPRGNALGRRELPKIRQAVQRLLDSVNQQDPAVCTQVYTKRYREQLMQRKGAVALQRCRKAVSESKVQAALLRIEDVRVRRTKAGTLTAKVQLLERIGTNGLLRARFTLIRNSGRYRIDSGHGEQVSSPEEPSAK